MVEKPFIEIISYRKIIFTELPTAQSKEKKSLTGLTLKLVSKSSVINIFLKIISYHEKNFY